MRPAELMSKYLSCNIWTGLHFFKVYSVRTVKLPTEYACHLNLRHLVMMTLMG